MRPPNGSIDLPESPFKGLASFEDSPLDAMLFFGREREREIIVANLLAARLTVLYGPSGVGKSSLLRAGVAHHLVSLDRKNVESGRDRELAVVVFSSWSGDVLADLRTAVESALFGGPGGVARGVWAGLFWVRREGRSGWTGRWSTPSRRGRRSSASTCA